MSGMKLNITQLQATIDALREEKSDRAAAILAFATIDALLENLLRAGMLPESPKDIFKGSGPLATVSAKIKMAFSFGLISKNEHQDLHLLRKIRNDFAHAYDHKLEFSSSSIESRIKALALPALLENTENFKGGDVKFRFYLGIALLITILSGYRVRTAPKRGSPPEVVNKKIDPTHPG